LIHFYAIIIKTFLAVPNFAKQTEWLGNTEQDHPVGLLDFSGPVDYSIFGLL
jgi:hypothetical protein